jgi:hypothetical protein
LEWQALVKLEYVQKNDSKVAEGPQCSRLPRKVTWKVTWNWCLFPSMGSTDLPCIPREKDLILWEGLGKETPLNIGLKGKKKIDLLSRKCISYGCKIGT